MSKRSRRSDHGTPSHDGCATRLLQDGLLLLAGTLVAAVGLKGFLVPNHFIDGGITGMSLLLHEVKGWNLGPTLIALNLPLVGIAVFLAGRGFALRMMTGVALLSLSLQFIPNLTFTNDKLLIAVFGGAFLGIGIGIAMRAGAALDGIEVLALFTLKRTSFSIAEIILAINILTFSAAAFIVGVEKALYSILTYFTASRCIDYVVEGFEAYIGVTVISGRSEEIKRQVVSGLGRGITVYRGQRGFLPGKFETFHDCDIIFAVITRLELKKMKDLVRQIDPAAFVYAISIRDAAGGILSRRTVH